MSDAQTISFFDITDLRNDGDALNNFARRFGLLPALDHVGAVNDFVDDPGWDL